MAARLPRVIGHRGAGVLAPENTLAGLRRAASIGLSWVELDVRLSADGVPMLFHDPTLERTTNGSGAIAALPVASLRRLDAGGWFGPAFRGEPLPTLADAIACLGRLGLAANIEIKADERRDDAASTVAHCLEKLWPRALPPPVVSSFEPAVLAAVAAVAPTIERALIVRQIPDDWRQSVNRLGCTALHCSVAELTPDRAAAVTATATALRCYTVNHRDDAARLFALGAESVFTDRPDRLLDDPGR